MKRLTSILLSALALLALSACGGDGGGRQDAEAPDLNRYYEDFMATLGEDNTPAMMDLDEDLAAGIYPGLEAYETRQSVLKVAAIDMTAYEFALVELADGADAQAVADIFQARIDAKVNGGAFYPASIEAWEKARVVTHGNVVALISASDEQDDALAAFNKLFA